jgi:hypothetical protein
LAVKDKIKPGLINIYTQPFDKKIIKEYLISLKEKQLEPDN